MEKHLYTCQYCSKEFEPKRRHAQKFCSNSCRSKSHRLKNKSKDEEQQLPSIQNNTVVETIPTEIFEHQKQQVEKMSTAGVGNAAAGTALVDLAKTLLTPEHQKTATKGDLNELKSLIKGYRYFPVKNMANDNYGRAPFFDLETSNLVYLSEKG